LKCVGEKEPLDPQFAAGSSQNCGGLWQHRMKEGEDGDQKCNQADPYDRTNAASRKASPCGLGLEKTFKWIAEHGTPDCKQTGKPTALHDFK
jgi:hypothetical protein